MSARLPHLLPSLLLQEQLKARKSGSSATSSSSSSSSSKASKRYLILSYIADFDKVHYPLPLSMMDKPTQEALQRQVRRLRREISSFKSLSGLTPNSAAFMAGGLPTAAQALLSSSITGMLQEVELLRRRQAESGGIQQEALSASRDAQQRTKAAQEALAASEAAMEKLRQASRAEVKRLQTEMGELRVKLADAEAGLGSMREAALLREAPAPQPHRRESEVIAQLRETNEVRERGGEENRGERERERGWVAACLVSCSFKSA